MLLCCIKRYIQAAVGSISSFNDFFPAAFGLSTLRAKHARRHSQRRWLRLRSLGISTQGHWLTTLSSPSKTSSVGRGTACRWPPAYLDRMSQMWLQQVRVNAHLRSLAVNIRNCSATSQTR